MERALRSPLLKYFLFFAAAILAWSLATKAHAATYYFVGTGGTVSGAAGRWETKQNWSTIRKDKMGGYGTHAVPGAGDTVILDNTGGNVIQIRSDVNIKGLFFSRSYTGALKLGTGALHVGNNGINIASGSLIGGFNSATTTSTLTSSGSFTQTGGIVRGFGTNMVLSGSVTIRFGGNANPSFTSTGWLILNGCQQQFIAGSADRTTLSLQHLGLRAPTYGSAARLVQVSGSGLVLNGQLTITGGTLDLTRSGRSVTIGTNLYLADSANAKVKGVDDLTVSGNLTVKPAANFTMTGGTTTLNGANKTLSGSMTFYNLTKNVTATDALYFYPGYTYTVAGTADLSGGSKILSLKSSIDTVQWSLTPPVKMTLVGLVLKDSYNTRLTNQVCLDCTDSGNNRNWDFEVTPTINATTTTTTSTSGGGGGGSRARLTATTPATTTTTTPTGPAPDATKQSNNPVTKSLQKRAATLQQTINGMKNGMQKNSMQRGLDRLNKLIKARLK